MADAKGRVTMRTGKLDMELQPNKPALGATGPTGAAFVGWVLIQVWEPTADNKGVSIHASGDTTKALRRAAEALAEVVR